MANRAGISKGNERENGKHLRIVAKVNLFFNDSICCYYFNLLGPLKGF